MRLTTAEKVNTGFALALGIVAIIGVASVTGIRRFAETSEALRHSHDAVAGMHSVLGDLSEAESAQRGYVITGDESYLEPFGAAVGYVQARLAALRVYTQSDAPQRARVDTLADLATRRLDIMTRVIEARRAGRFEDAGLLIRGGRGRQVMDSIRATVEVLRDVERTRLAERSASARATGRIVTAIIAGGGVFAFLIVLASSLAVRRDFSERRRVEGALRESETLLSQFMEHLPIGVLVVDAAGRLRFANNAAVATVGPSMLLNAGEQPLPLYRRNAEERYPEQESPIMAALRGHSGTITDAETHVDGRRFPVEVSAAPIYDSAGRIAYAVATFSDVTGRRAQEEALRAAKEGAEAANRTKSEFLARMSHELRTPLNSVIGFANILRKNRGGTLREQEIAYLDRIVENGKHLLHLINDILDLSKIEAGKIEVERESVQLTELVRDVAAHWRPSVKNAPVRLRTVLPRGLQPLQTDAARLRQVLLNLVDNARKFTVQGHVEVRVHATRDGVPTQIAVEDTGIGIPAERLEAIFDLFEQAESTTSRQFGGTGLGLPISRALCELLGYELRVTSTPGAGSTFVIDLRPDAATSAGAAAMSSRTSPTREADGDRLVLIIDDEADSRILLTHYVEEYGCRAIATHAAASALTLARELKPSLITLDLMMPGVDGWDLLAELKSDPELADTPVVVISIIAQESRATLLGAADILQKPIDRERLFAVLEQHLGVEAGES